MNNTPHDNITNHNEKILSREEVRALDRQAIEEFGMPGIILMENAGRGVVDYMLSCHAQGKIVICCGKGNNAGDGFVVARHLDNLGLAVHVLLFSNPEDYSGDAKINYEIAQRSLLPMTTIAPHENINEVIEPILAKADWIIDALFGTGLKGKVQPPYDSVIQTINQISATILAIDIPSGLDCDSGQPLGCAVKAQHTVTFVAIKKGFTEPNAKQYIGHVHVVDIGLPKILQTTSKWKAPTIPD